MTKTSARYGIKYPAPYARNQHLSISQIIEAVENAAGTIEAGWVEALDAVTVAVSGDRLVLVRSGVAYAIDVDDLWSALPNGNVTENGKITVAGDAPLGGAYLTIGDAGPNTVFGSGEEYEALYILSPHDSSARALITLAAGETTDQNAYIRWRSVEGSEISRWYMGVNQTDSFIVYNDISNYHALTVTDNGYTAINADGAGANAVRVGFDTGGVTGSGGIEVYNGTTFPDSADLYGSITAAGVTSATTVNVASYTIAELPAAGTPGRMAFVTDDVGGSVIAFDDGSNWRRCTDRAVVSAT